MLKDGKLNLLGRRPTTTFRRRRTAPTKPIRAIAIRTNFIVVSDAYPTVTAMAADLILPTAMWVEKEGAYGNAERRTQFWHQLVDAPGEARSDLWQIVEFSKRFMTEEVWPAEILAANPDFRGKTLYDVLFRNGQVDRFPVTDMRSRATPIRKPQRIRLLSAQGPVRGIRRRSVAATATIWRRSTPITRCAACAGRWWTARKPGGVIAKGLDPYVKAGEGVRFYGRPDGRAVILAAPYEPPAECPDERVQVLAGDRTRAGALAFRIDDHARAGTVPRRSPARACS